MSPATGDQLKPAAVSRTRLLERARVVLNEGKAKDAITVLEELLAGEPDWPAALHELGRAQLILGELDSALKSFIRALDLNPTTPGLALSYARARKFSSPCDPHIETIKTTVSDPALDPLIAADLHFALGKIHDDLERYDDAFEHYRKANELMSSRLNYDNAKTHRAISNLISTFTLRYFDTRLSERSSDTRAIFIVGMPRSATTLVEQILATHPSIRAGGELDSMQRISIEYSTKVGATYPASMRRMTGPLARRFADAYLASVETRVGPCERFTDKMPTNYFHLGLIATLLPNATIIHCRRNPIDVAVSNYFQQYETGNDWAYDMGNIVKFYRHYARLMSHWRKVLPVDMLEIDYESLISDQEGTCRALLAHCRVPWRPECLEFFRVKGTVTTSSNWQVRQPLYSDSLERWRHYRQHISPLIDGLRGLGNADG